jgi:hypothetical protein
MSLACDEAGLFYQRTPFLEDGQVDIYSIDRMTHPLSARF